MQSVSVGRTKVSVEARGCFGCGTLYSSGWETHCVVEVDVNGRRLMVAIPVCADCMKKGTGKSE